ncbi:hypothetical protein R3P38DRAFT_2498123 [Favolaschia claudopus]|uniref:BTB domain-containing protein n=1 Tax=Favolaschia claudopus TaxID=2862362 RepID=A0AAW0E1S3_9AGAR
MPGTPVPFVTQPVWSWGNSYPTTTAPPAWAQPVQQPWSGIPGAGVGAGAPDPFAVPQDQYGVPPLNSYQTPGYGAPGYPLPPPQPSAPKHPRFFFEDGNVAIIIENTLYKLHRYLFGRSNLSMSMYSDRPVYLWNPKKDFDRFLTVLYPSDYSKHECETAEEWMSVLTIADQFDMHDIRRLAIKQLADTAGPVDKIVLGHRYQIKEWLAPAYLALATRSESVSPAEGAKLGVDALVRLAALQDEVYRNLKTYVDPEKFAELFASKLAI